MASDFQRRKVAGVFNAMDADQDGFLDEADFEALTARWIGIRTWAPGSERPAQLTAIMMGWWAALLAASDLDRDNKVTLDEVLLVMDQLGTMSDAVAGTASAMFEAIDESVRRGSSDRPRVNKSGSRSTTSGSPVSRATGGCRRGWDAASARRRAARR